MIKVVSASTGAGKTSWPAATPFLSDTNGKVPHPRELGLPHDTWRKHQYETLLWLTGGEAGRVVSLVKTKSLQASNYDETYGFDAHYGRANYRCNHPGAEVGATCDKCMFLETGSMQNCPVSNGCSYLLSKHAAMNSRKASLNYAYWMTARNWRNSFPPDVLYCDEAHNLSEIVLDWVGVTVTEKQRREWDLPTFPKADSSRGSGILTKVEPPTDIAVSWLSRSNDVMSKHRRRLESADREKFNEADRLGRKLSNALSALRQYPDDWFILSGSSARMYRGKAEPGFTCRPLTARHHASGYFTGTFDSVLMSATIGNPGVFAEELGLAEYEARTVPNQWPSSARPIYILDTPKMGYVKGETKIRREVRFGKQADAIASFIKQWPSAWPGLVHVTRKTEEVALAERLASRGLSDRAWVIPGKVESYVPTDRQLRQWERRKNKIPNSILITCSFGEGYDGLDEKINVSAKVPFPRIGSRGSYEFAWMTYNKKRYDWRTAVALAQQQGRNRRGRECDYDVPGEARGANAIADASWERVYPMLPEDIQEAIIRI